MNNLIRYSCVSVAESILDSCLYKLSQIKKRKKNIPSLSIYSNGSPEGQAYIRSKQKMCDMIGLDCQVHVIEKPVIADLPKIAKQIVNDPASAIIVQLPFFSRPYRDMELISFIPPEKDVDGLTRGTYFKPATAKGIVEFIKRNYLYYERKNVVIIGRSKLVGLPLAQMLLTTFSNLTVTVCHSRTKDIKQFTKNADIIIVAVGKKDYLTKDMVKENTIIIDVGINKGKDGKLYGDVAKDVNDICYVTPVPGGVGKLTVASLIDNVVNAKYYIDHCVS